MTDTYRPVKRHEKLSVQVAEQIIDLIIDGKLLEGERLPPERDFCETFEVSRTVIREAVSILEAKGLVYSVTGSGTYVRSIQQEDVVNSLGLYISTNTKSVSVEHLLEARWVIESQVARFAANRATDEDLQLLEDVWLEMCDLTDDPMAFSKKDLDFHVRLAHASGNPLFEIMLQPLTDFILQSIYVVTTLPGITKQACDYHRAVIDAIKIHDSEMAVTAIQEHLKQSRVVTIRGLREKERVMVPDRPEKES